MLNYSLPRQSTLESWCLIWDFEAVLLVSGLWSGGGGGDAYFCDGSHRFTVVEGLGLQIQATVCWVKETCLLMSSILRGKWQKDLKGENCWVCARWFTTLALNNQDFPEGTVDNLLQCKLFLCPDYNTLMLKNKKEKTFFCSLKGM